jgi:hypothetical protein
MNSASLYCCSENVSVPPVIIAELELGNIERHIFAAHFVECADHAALEDRPEPFDCLSVNCADDVLASRMVNGRVRKIFVESPISGPLISAKQADLVGDGFSHKRVKRCGLDVRDYPRNHIALAANSADDWSFAGTDAAGSPAAAAFIPMPIFCQAADESLIDFDNSAELINVLHESGSDLMAHEPRGFIGAEAHVTMDLASANSFLACQHKMNDTKPVAERFIRVFENRSCNMREAVAFRCASVALPMPRHCRDLVIDHRTAPRAANAFGPAPADEVGTTSVFVREHRLELRDAHLMNLRGLFCSSHDDLSFVGETIA